MLSKIRQYFELIKYCFFGGITTLLNLALLYVFVEMGMNYIVADVYKRQQSHHHERAGRL